MTPQKEKQGRPSKRRKKALHMEKMAPLKGENRKIIFSSGATAYSCTSPPPPHLLSEYIQHIITSKYTLKCPKLNSSLKIIFRRAYPGNPLDYLKTDTPKFEHVFLPVIKEHSISHPSLPRPDRVGDHNAMPAFPQEKISHYTTAYR